MSIIALAFSREEYLARLERTQRAMAARGLDALLLHSPENICYLSGFHTCGYFAYQVLAVPAEGDPRLLVRYMERGWAEEQSWLPEVQTWRDGDDMIAATAGMLVKTGTIGVETSSLTVDTWKRLRERLAPSRIVSAGLLVDEVRLLKSAAEVECIRAAATIAESGMRAGLAAIHEGATELEVAAAIHRAEILENGEYTGLPHLIGAGPRATLGHATWTDRRLERGETVRLELSGCRHRYHGAVMRTACVGSACGDARCVAAAVIDAQDAFLAALRPGAQAGELDALVREPIRATLRPDYYNRSGYSIGIGFPPRWGEWDALEFTEGAQWEVRENMVFHILTTARGIGISETVVVRADGAERLTTLPRVLEETG